MSGRNRRRPRQPEGKRTAGVARIAQTAGPRGGATRWTRWVAYGAIALYGLYWAVKAFGQHHLGNYAVETDFYWKYGPAAAALKQGRVLIEHFDSKGWGYPMVVAAVSALGFSLFRAGQIVALLSACAAAWFLYRLHRSLAGPTIALLSVFFLLGNPTFLANTYEVGTDMFFFAIVMGSLALLLRSGEPRWTTILGSGLLGGWAFSTRYNGLFLWPAALIAILALRAHRGERSDRWRSAIIWSAGFVVAALPWLAVNWIHTGNPLTNDNYTNVGYAVYGNGNWEKFFYGGDRKIHSFGDVVMLDPARFVGAMLKNTVEHARRDLSELLPAAWGVPALWGVLAILGALVVWWERPGRRLGAYLLAGLLYFVTLVPVFYGTRFSLPMLAFYAALACWPFASGKLGAAVAGIERYFPIRSFAFLLLWIPGAVGAYGWTEDPRNPESLRAAPYETLPAAEFLKARAAGEALLARKPHVAFEAGMRFVPMPQVETPADLHKVAVQSGARYLLVSSAEFGMRAAVRPFAEPAAAIPGFRRVFESPGALVYEVLPDSAATHPAAALHPAAAP